MADDALARAKTVLDRLTSIQQQLQQQERQKTELEEQGRTWHFYRHRLEGMFKETNVLQYAIADFQKDRSLSQFYPEFSQLIPEYQQTKEALSALEKRCTEIIGVHDEQLRNQADAVSQALINLREEEQQAARDVETMLVECAPDQELLVQLYDYARSQGGMKGTELARSPSLFIHRAVCTAYAQAHQPGEVLFESAKPIERLVVIQTLENIFQQYTAGRQQKTISALLLSWQEPDQGHENFQENLPGNPQGDLQRLVLHHGTYVLLAPSTALYKGTSECAPEPLVQGHSFYTQEIIRKAGKGEEGPATHLTKLLLFSDKKRTDDGERFSPTYLLAEDLSKDAFLLAFRGELASQQRQHSLQNEVQYLSQFEPEND